MLSRWICAAFTLAIETSLKIFPFWPAYGSANTGITYGIRGAKGKTQVSFISALAYVLHTHDLGCTCTFQNITIRIVVARLYQHFRTCYIIIYYLVRMTITGWWILKWGWWWVQENIILHVVKVRIPINIKAAFSIYIEQICNLFLFDLFV